MPVTYDLVTVLGAAPYGFMWDLETNLPDSAFTTTIPGVSYSSITVLSDLNLMGIGHYYGTGFSLFDISSVPFQKLTLPFSLPSNPNAAVLSRDGAVCFSAHPSNVYAVYDIATGTVLTSQYAFAAALGNGMATSKDGKWLGIAYGGSVGGRTADVMDLATKQLVGIQTNIAGGQAYRCAFSDDNSMFAVAHSANPSYFVWNTSTWQLITGLPNINANNHGIAFSPDGRFLALAPLAAPGLYVVDLQSKTIVNTGLSFGVANSVCFTPDSKTLYLSTTAAPFIHKIDVATWQEEALPLVMAQPLPGYPTAMAIVAPEQFGKIVGTVRDINGDPVSREIRVFRRSDGEMVARTLSDATTGDYELAVANATADYDVQALAANGEQLNDLFYARVMPG